MGLLNGTGIFRGLKSIGKSSVRAGIRAFPDMLRRKDFFIDDAGVVQDKWTPIGEYEVGSKMIVHVGQGSREYPEHAGFIYVTLAKSDGNLIDGKLRIIAKDPNDVGKGMIFNQDLDTLGGDPNDKAKMTMLEEDELDLEHEDRIVLEVLADETATIDFDNANTNIKIPIMKKYTRQL
ncbi:MAG: hypothetical protein OQK82_02085 [Candidatus Pacearchaeota archaeon]|nr:hypothetical protein [Candidatus Pacearchaeota archaeon]